MCRGDDSGGGGERLGRPGSAPTRWMALGPLAVGYLVPWVSRRVGFGAPCRRRRPAPGKQVVAFLAACSPRAPHCSAPAPHALFPCRPPSGRGRARYGQSSRGGRTTGSGWLRPSAGPSKAPRLRALVQEGPGAPCLGHPPGPLSGCLAGEGCCALADQRWPPAHRQRQTDRDRQRQALRSHFGSSQS